MKRITSRLRSAFTPESEEHPQLRRAIEAAQQVDLFGPSLAPIPSPITPDQERRRSDFEQARTRKEAVEQDKAEGGEAEEGESRETEIPQESPTQLNEVIGSSQERQGSAESSAPTYTTPSHPSLPTSRRPSQVNSQLSPSPLLAPRQQSSHGDRRPSNLQPSWQEPAVPPSFDNFAFPTTNSPSGRRPSTTLTSPQSSNSLRQRHTVKFSLPIQSSPQLDGVENPTNDLPLSSPDSTDSLFSVSGIDPLSPSETPVNALPAVPPKDFESSTGPIPPTSVVRWAVNDEMEYELSKSVGKDVFEQALQDEGLTKEFQEYFAAHKGDASLLNLYIDLRSFSTQSAQLRSTASTILASYFNPQSPSRLQLPISLRGPIIHSLTPLSSTLLSLETAEQDLFGKIHDDHFEGFTQERLIGMAVKWLSTSKRPSEKEPTKPEVDWSKRGLGFAFCLTNPRLWDNPMIFMSEAFAELTGYLIEEIVGLNCRVFQGPCTSQSSHLALRQAIYGEQAITKLVLNYRRNGEPFYNLIQVIPIKNPQGETQFFLGGVNDVTDLLHPFSTSPPDRGPSGDGAPKQIYPKVLLARPASRKIIFSTPEVSALLGFASSTSLIGLDLLNLLSPGTTAPSPLLSSSPLGARKETEVVPVQQAIAAAIRRGDTWRGEVELDCRRPDEDEQGGVGSGTPATGAQETTKCILHLSPLLNEEGKPKMLVIILA